MRSTAKGTPMSGVMTRPSRVMNTRNPGPPLILSLRPRHRVPRVLWGASPYPTQVLAPVGPLLWAFPAEGTSSPLPPPGPPPELPCPVPGGAVLV